MESNKKGWQTANLRVIHHQAPLERLELSLSAPEADALSAELQGQALEFYHRANIPEVEARQGGTAQYSVSRDRTSKVKYADWPTALSLAGSMVATVS